MWSKVKYWLTINLCCGIGMVAQYRVPIVETALIPFYENSMSWLADVILMLA